MKREVIVFILLVCAFLAIGCTGQQPTAPANETPATPVDSTTEGNVIEVSIQNFAFEPKSVKISWGYGQMDKT